MKTSDEARALVRHLVNMGVPHRVTSIARRASRGSWHSVPGTNGHSLAVDFAGPTPCARGCEALQRIFDAFVPIETLLTELIYSGAPYSIKDGKQTKLGYGNPSLIAAHWNHVHVAVSLGTNVLTPVPSPASSKTRPRRSSSRWLYPDLYLHGRR